MNKSKKAKRDMPLASSAQHAVGMVQSKSVGLVALPAQRYGTATEEQSLNNDVLHHILLGLLTEAEHRRLQGTSRTWYHRVAKVRARVVQLGIDNTGSMLGDGAATTMAHEAWITEFLQGSGVVL